MDTLIDTAGKAIGGNFKIEDFIRLKPESSVKDV
jgi:hypothetical protein